MTKLKFCFVLISLILIGTFSRVNAQGCAIMLPYGSEPQLEWIHARNLSEQEAPDLWVFQGNYGGFDRVYWDLSTYTYYLIEQYPGEVFTTQWYVNIDYLTDFQLFVGSMPLILESYDWTEPDFSYQDTAYATEQTAWDSFIGANDALIAQRISEDNAAAMQRAREIVAAGRPVQINYDDGTTEIRLPDGSTKTFDNPNGLKVVVPVYADGYKFDGIGLSESAVNILNDPSRKITSYAQAESQATIDATFAQTARSVADANNALFDLWLKRDMALGSFGDPSSVEGYIGAGAFGHSFDGWLDWDDETNAWNTSELINMFLAELPYQVPVFNIGYKVGTAVLPYTVFVPYEDYGGVAQDPFTGNALSSGGLLLEAGIDAGALVVSYRLVLPAYSFGSYTDDLLSAEIRTFAAEKIPWGFWGDYAKVTVNGRQYAQVGDRLYTRHAVDRMTPSGLGTAAGGSKGRSVAPQFVDDVLSSPSSSRSAVTGPAGEARISTRSGSLEVITEGNVVITIITH